MGVTVIGDAFIDVIVPMPDLKPGETHHGRVITRIGGSANLALRISRLGEKVSFVGKRGNDPFGRYIRRNLRKSGVEDLTCVDPEKETGLCVSLVYAGGERAMIASRGANDSLNRQDIERNLGRIAGSKIVYFSGYSFASTTTSEGLLFAASACRDRSEIWLNPGAPNTIRDPLEAFIKDLADVLVLNLDEARVLTAKHEVQDVVSGLKGIVGLAAITLGRDGCLVLTSEGHMHTPASYTGEVRDTTGAGDAFAAGFVVARLRGLGLTECAELGNKSAAEFLVETSEALK